MIAFKFLSAGAVGPFTGFRWPLPSSGCPGAWVDAPQPKLELFVHACRPEDLPYWIDEELWRAELDEPVRERERQVVSPRARLLERVEAWDAAAVQALAEACAWRAREHAAALAARDPATAAALERCSTLEDLRDTADALTREGGVAAAIAGFVSDAVGNAIEAGARLPRAWRPHGAVGAACAAYIAASAAGTRAARPEEGFARERAWQARWLAERLQP